MSRPSGAAWRGPWALYVDKACSGGYAIAGDSGLFLTTAAMCSVGLAPDGSIRGDAGYHADVFARRDTDPLVLLRMRPGNDAFQILIDPVTGAIPGDGSVAGGREVRISPSASSSARWG